MTEQRTITIAGAGLAGLVAAITSAEGGARVVLHEAQRQPGGRARTLDGPHRANVGPHVLYADSAVWAWLQERNLLPPCSGPPLAAPIVFREQGQRRRVPPLGVARALLHRTLTAPVDRRFGDWAAERFGPETATRLGHLAGVFSFDHDPSRLSAAFVWERLVRVTALPPSARYPERGWGSVVDRLVARATELGVELHTASPVTEVPAGPAVLALPLEASRRLTGDDTLRWEHAHVALLDLGLRSRRRDPIIVADLDAPGWVETFSLADTTLAPAGERLVQAQVGIRPGEELPAAVARIEALLDVGLRGWRERETWRAEHALQAPGGALDRPGTTWRDRPAVDRGHGLFLAGDMVAAPGLLSDVAFNSAIEAARGALAWRAQTAAAGGEHRVAAG